ncbi:hypothetical protein F5876DRAFT_71709 [Lentinula aff. lateritia]|uniref:Uncharacterized protein n=1 Tax=Lentinula aff. lateritia TaxID=2804960 RepID=A0ACC1UF81_9AGAR|nr:hypothetical protein F5876DRAFT_71709 [Lentinula aff. lateritia]
MFESDIGEDDFTDAEEGEIEDVPPQTLTDPETALTYRHIQLCPRPHYAYFRQRTGLTPPSYPVTTYPRAEFENPNHPARLLISLKRDAPQGSEEVCPPYSSERDWQALEQRGPSLSPCLVTNPTTDDWGDFDPLSRF